MYQKPTFSHKMLIMQYILLDKIGKFSYRQWFQNAGMLTQISPVLSKPFPFCFWIILAHVHNCDVINVFNSCKSGKKYRSKIHRNLTRLCKTTPRLLKKITSKCYRELKVNAPTKKTNAVGRDNLLTMIASFFIKRTQLPITLNIDLNTSLRHLFASPSKTIRKTRSIVS